MDDLKLTTTIRKKTYIVSLIITAFFVVLFLRLTDVMVVRGDTFREVADANRFYIKTILPNRGIILDRNGKVLVYNSPIFLIPQKGKTSKSSAEQPITLDAQAAFDQMRNDPASVVENVSRVYADPNISHVLGYVGFVNPSQNTFISSLDEKVGKAGIEKSFDDTLRGSVGSQTYEVSATGKLVRKIQEDPPISGKNITLSIDADLSDYAVSLLGSSPGSVVLSDIDSGEVLALVSTPSYSQDKLVSYFKDPSTPLLNRALRSYPPGSVFKMMTALAGLSSGTITSDSLIQDNGQITVGQSTGGQNVFGNWLYREYGRKDGDINLTQAISRSNDIFFYKTAQGVGPDLIAQTAKLFRLGQKTGIELPEDDPGLIPTPAWKEQFVGSKWFLGDTYHMGIGQGDVLVTPLQINIMTATLARRGKWCTPTLIKGTSVHCEDVGIPDQYFSTIIDGMVGACSKGGTAFPFFAQNEAASDSAKIACKTGTAEFGAADSQGRRKTHAWFTAFYPSIQPKIAITVMKEATPQTPFLEGSIDAAPIAKAMIERWLEQGVSRSSH